MNHLLTLGLVLALAAPALAHADTEVEPSDATSTTVTAPAASTLLAPAPEPEAAPRWYGNQVLLADGTALALVLAGAVAGGAGNDTVGLALAYGGLATYALGGPIVHLAHDRPGAALGSLSLRVGLPAVSGLMGMAIEQQSCHPGQWFCGLGGMMLGGLVGMAGAVAIDAAALAYAPRTELRVAPMVGGGRLGMSVGGVF